MDLLKYLSVLVIFVVDANAGGHGGKHHVNLKIHLPEFVHHDHHKKVITIHHHHHKPKKEHYQHHHHHKPQVPHGHHYHHHHQKTSTHSVSKGHSNHGHTGKGHSNHGHTGKGHSHHGHHKAHDSPVSYDPPTVNYLPASINYEPPRYDYSPPNFNHDAYGPSAPSASSAPSAPDSPRVHGVVHTVKQVKVFNSLPSAAPTAISGGNLYEVTEEATDEDDIFSVNTSQAFPGLYGYGRTSAAGTDPFTGVVQGSHQANYPFANAVEAPSYPNIESFAADVQNQHASNVDNSPQFQFPGNGHIANGEGAVDDLTNIIGDDTGFHDGPVLTREAGITESFNTAGIQSVTY